MTSLWQWFCCFHCCYWKCKNVQIFGEFLHENLFFRLMLWSKLTTICHCLKLLIPTIHLKLALLSSTEDWRKKTKVILSQLNLSKRCYALLTLLKAVSQAEQYIVQFFLTSFLPLSCKTRISQQYFPLQKFIYFPPSLSPFFFSSNFYRLNNKNLRSLDENHSCRLVSRVHFHFNFYRTQVRS